MATFWHIEPSEPSSAHATDYNAGGHSAADHGGADLVSTADQFMAFIGGDDMLDGQLDQMPTRWLRAMINGVFKSLDSPHPPIGAHDRYETLLDILEERDREASRRGQDVQVRESFRDNVLYRRFELRIDGILAAHLKYRIRAGRITLTDGVEYPEFRDQDTDVTLLHHVLLNTHKRRLSVIPQCPMVFAFLADNPQYEALAALDAAPSPHLHS